MYLELERSLREGMLKHLASAYAWTPAQLVVEQPPKPELGDFALPVSFELAKQLRRSPRQIAQELAIAFALPQGFARVAVAGAGYLNFFVDRAAAWQAQPARLVRLVPRLEGKVIIEHTNINPNKAAHIGHLRNAVLGDTWVRLLRQQGEQVEVHNLQDNTGVQVADVVAAFLHLGPARGDAAAALAQVESALGSAEVRFDYLCWDQYAAISQHYEQHPDDLKAWRPATLHAIESGQGPVAELAERISSAVALCHLRTMERLHVRYDVLPRESEILQLRLWEHAFRLLRERGAVRLETEGKNQGCWVMDRTFLGTGPSAAPPRAPLTRAPGRGPHEPQPGARSTSPEGEEESKVIVRSNGTVTYVGKDIAYQLWKFGLLPLEFGFVPFHRYPGGRIAWTTALTSAPNAPAFGRGAWVYNVIDARQSYLQEIVVAGLRALQYEREAEHSIHFSYEMVALSPACAAELGYTAAAGEKRVDVSGRKGTGVKADDLIDRLLERTLAEVSTRHPEMAESERRHAADAIAIGALRYFLLKYTRSTVIAFDFKEALSFEGETGPYVQYAAVRAANILAKAAAGADTPVAEVLTDDTLWSLYWLAARLEATVEQAIAAQEPAFLAKYAFQLAQSFNVFYHHTPVTQEPDAGRRAALLALVKFVQDQLAAALDLMGIAVPAAM